MKKDFFYFSVLKVGAFSVVITGVCFFIIAICALFAPKAVASYVTSTAYFDEFMWYQEYFILIKYLMFVAFAAMIGFIISIYYHKCRPQNGLFILLSVLAILGIGIGMLQSITDATRVPHLAQEYENSSDIIRHVIIAFGVANPAIYMLSLGLPGLWLIFLNIWMRKEFSLFLVLSGFAWGIGSVVTVIGHLFVILPIIHFIAFGAVFGVPVWTYLQTKFLLKCRKDAMAKSLSDTGGYYDTH